jgi:hypothetical protein
VVRALLTNCLQNQSPASLSFLSTASTTITGSGYR